MSRRCVSRLASTAPLGQLMAASSARITSLSAGAVIGRCSHRPAPRGPLGQWLMPARYRRPRHGGSSCRGAGPASRRRILLRRRVPVVLAANRRLAADLRRKPWSIHRQAKILRQDDANSPRTARASSVKRRSPAETTKICHHPKILHAGHDHPAHTPGQEPAQSNCDAAVAGAGLPNADGLAVAPDRGHDVSRQDQGGGARAHAGDG